QNMVVLSANDGKIITTLPIGRGTDGAVFNPNTMEAFSAQVDGTLTVVKEMSPTNFMVEQTVQTMPSAKTLTLDAKTNNIYLIGVTSAGMDALEKEKLVVPGTRVELARALVGIAVRDGAPVPNIATPDALKQRLMSARAVAYIDPKIGGQAGATIVALLKGM